jgi:hypothetical protein
MTIVAAERLTSVALAGNDTGFDGGRPSEV